MASQSKTSTSIVSYLTLGSLLAAHLLIFPLYRSNSSFILDFLPPALRFDHDVDDEMPAPMSEILETENQEEKTSTLLSVLTEDEKEDLHSDLYVATNKYPNGTEFDDEEYLPSESIYSLPQKISYLKLQGKQNFGVDEFVNEVDITEIVNGERNKFSSGSDQVSIGELAADGSGDSSGSDQSGSGSGENVDTCEGDASGEPDGASGSFGDTSGDDDQSGSGGESDTAGEESGQMSGASGHYSDSSGDDDGSGSKEKKKKDCVIQ